MHILASAIAIIKSAYAAKLAYCYVRKNSFVLRLATSLKALGYIRGFTVLDRLIIIHLQYKRTKLGLRRLALFTKMTNRVYLNKKQIGGRSVHGYYKNNGAILLLTTRTAGFLTQWECASLGIGGTPKVSVG